MFLEGVPTRLSPRASSEGSGSLEDSGHVSGTSTENTPEHRRTDSAVSQLSVPSSTLSTVTDVSNRGRGFQGFSLYATKNGSTFSVVSTIMKSLFVNGCTGSDDVQRVAMFQLSEGFPQGCVKYTQIINQLMMSVC